MATSFQLPDDCLQEVLSHLPRTNLLHVQFVNRQFHFVAARLIADTRRLHLFEGCSVQIYDAARKHWIRFCLRARTLDPVRLLKSTPRGLLRWFDAAQVDVFDGTQVTQLPGFQVRCSRCTNHRCDMLPGVVARLYEVHLPHLDMHVMIGIRGQLMGRSALECNGEWEALSQKILPRNTAMVRYQQSLFFCGGVQSGTMMKQAWRYDIDSDQWFDLADMLIARCNAVLAVCGDRLFVMGGDYYSAPLSYVESYDILNDVWTQEEPLVKPVTQGIAVYW
eukprot:TRINITY_DN11319_c0_g3_i1.p1 TRINITY_DN11319_c0_g3~~TRINITY_DN11319_c0_g3_i1.p1  ORF type:complete len:299 (-),score=38.39 TRINITY_DN11319_c0_g3_i1:987-1820(-)